MAAAGVVAAHVYNGARARASSPKVRLHCANAEMWQRRKANATAMAELTQRAARSYQSRLDEC